MLTDATFVSAIIAALAAFGTILWQHFKDKEALRHALFAELRHIRQHYGYAIAELPSTVDTDPPDIELKWSKYGEVQSAKELAKFAILGANQMQLLLQISLRIRNTDIYIDHLLGRLSPINSRDIIQLRERMDYIRSSADKLVEFIRKKDSSLAKLSELE